MRQVIAVALILASFTCSAQVKLLTLDKLEQRIAKGKDTTYVVNFWATWCSPCVAELPNFEKLAKEYNTKPIKVILMSLDFKSKLEKDVIPFVNRHKLISEVYVVDAVDKQDFIERVNKKWSGALPATWFINNSKQINAFYEKEFTYGDLNNTLINLR